VSLWNNNLKIKDILVEQRSLDSFWRFPFFFLGTTNQLTNKQCNTVDKGKQTKHDINKLH